MKSILFAATISLVASASAFAFEHHAPDQAKLRASNAMVIGVDSNDVFVRGRLIGRDPDPAIRARLRDEFYALGR